MTGLQFLQPHNLMVGDVVRIRHPKTKNIIDAVIVSLDEIKENVVTIKYNKREHSILTTDIIMES